MKILLGTTNPSKVKHFEEFLDGCDVTFCTLRDLDIHDEPEETGRTPEENAILKARFYGKYFDTVICNDSGLYFAGLPLDDPRQPGLHVRTPLGGARMDDEEMLRYYTDLVHSLGGRVTAFYLNGLAVYRSGQIYSFLEDPDTVRADAFYMVDRPCEKRHEGWSLDSISLNRTTLTYFVEEDNELYDVTEETALQDPYWMQVIRFLKESLGLTA